MKKIIFIVSTLNTGGAQKILSNLLMGLPDEYEADIVLNDTEDIVYPYKGNLISLGFKPQDNKLSLLYQIRVFLRRIHQLRKMKATGDYVAAVSFLDSANIANIISGNRHCRTILSAHSNLTESAVSWIYKYMVNPMVRMLYGRADRIIAVSKGIAYDLTSNLKLSDRNIVTIYNGHDINGIQRMAAEVLPPEVQKYYQGTPVIATMGRMNYAKGQWHLIRALQRVKEEFPQIRLLLVGDGELRQYLEQLADGCGVKENVIFCGFHKNPFAILSRSDVFVFPSMYEGFPNALIEALGCGLPCIATDFHSGAREILAPELPVNGQIKAEIYQGRFGILTPVCDGKQYDGKAPLTEEELFLAEAIIELLKNKQLQENYKNRTAEAIKDSSVESMVRKWLEVIVGQKN